MVRSWEAHQGRNHRTGESIQIAARSVPKFSAGAELKKAALEPEMRSLLARQGEIAANLRGRLV